MPMRKESSYDILSFSTSMQAEIRRLNAQVDLFWPAEQELLLRYGLRENMDLLDCGCGPGRLLELLKGHLPKLRCTGLELDPLLVDEAEQRIAAADLRDCRIVRGTAEKHGLAASKFDFIVLRLVLEHLPDPAQALRGLRQLLRPGGRLIVIANDFGFHLQTWPPVPQLARLYEAYCASRSEDGGDPCIGRRLPQLLSQAGLTVIGYEIEVAHNALLGDGPFLKSEGAGIPAKLVQTGFLDELTFEEMTRAWMAMLAEQNHSIVRQLFVGVGERSLEAETIAVARIMASEKEPVRHLDQVAASKQSAGALEGNLKLVLRLVSEALEMEAVKPGDSLADLGIDSLAAMTLQDRIRSGTGVEISIVTLLGNTRVEELARQLDAELLKLQSRQSFSQKRSDARAATHWVEGEI